MLFFLIIPQAAKLFLNYKLVIKYKYMSDKKMKTSRVIGKILAFFQDTIDRIIDYFNVNQGLSAPLEIMDKYLDEFDVLISEGLFKKTDGSIGLVSLSAST